MQHTTDTPAVSIILPVRDEAVAIRALADEIAAVMSGPAGRPFEVIIVDDGSQDGTGQILATLAARNPWLRHLRHPVSRGQSTAIRTGVRAARAPLIVTLDGDGQNPPDQIPLLLAPLEADPTGRLGLVQGQRAVRRDTLGKRLASRFANHLRAALLRDGVRDSGCGLKAFRRDAYLELPFFDHIHRFMPAMMLREGWQVQTRPVSHRARAGGRSKYSNLARALVGIPDLMGAAWLILRSGRVDNKGQLSPSESPASRRSGSAASAGPDERATPQPPPAAAAGSQPVA